MSKQLRIEDFIKGDKIVGFGEPHLACALLLDTSSSMSGNAICSLNEGIRRFKATVAADPIAQKRVDVALVTFNSTVDVISDFVPISQMPTPELHADGLTSMAEAIQTAIDLVKRRTEMYQTLGTPCHKPWIFMMTDGASTSEAYDMEQAARRIKLEEAKGTHGHLSFWTLGTGDYDADEIFQLTHRDRVLELRDENFVDIFNWLSESMSAISQSQVGEQVEFNLLPDNVRKAQKDRAISDEWY